METASNAVATPRRATEPERGSFREAWGYRELFVFLALRDIKVRYKQTALGVVWALLQPLLTMLIFMALRRLANLPTDGVPASIFYLSALVPWIYFSSALNQVGMSLVSNTNLLTKIYFPRIILPTSAALGGLLDFLVGSLLLVPLLIYFQIGVTPAILLWPVLVVLLFLLVLAIGALLAALNVRYRDVKYVIPFAVQIGLFVTPIIYPTSMVPERYQWLLALNPLTGIIEAFRYTLVPNAAFQWSHLGISVAMTAVLLYVALVFFRNTERSFADIV